MSGTKGRDAIATLVSRDASRVDVSVPRKEARMHQNPYRMAALALAALVCLGKLSTQTAAARSISERFETNGAVLIVSTFHEPKEPPPNKLGVIGIIDGKRRNSFVFGVDQLQSFLDLWMKASAFVFDTEKLAGTLAEKGTDDDLHLVLIGGQDVTFVLASRQHGVLKVALRRADVGRFEKAIRLIEAFLQEQ